MTRAPLDYSSAAQPVRMAGGIDVTTPVAGLFRHRLTSGGVAVAVRIWFGPPKDPVTGEELDRSWRWQAEADGHYIDFDRVWPVCAGSPIDEKEYSRLLSQSDWARQHAPRSAVADPLRKVDLLSPDTPMLF